MGGTVWESDGAWWIFVNHQGKRRAKRVGVGDAGKKNAARKAAEKIQARLVLGDLSVLESPKPVENVLTFKDLAAEWELVKAPDLKRGMRVSYANAIRKHLNVAFGDLPITDVTEERIETCQLHLRNSGASPRHAGTLRVICRRAVSLKLLLGNPVSRIEGEIGKAQGEIRKRTDSLAADDLATFLHTAKRVCLREYPVLLAMATCGLRVGEAVGLQVGDLDGPEFRLHIRRAVRHGYIDSPKNGNAGIVDVPRSTMAVLQRLKERRQVEAAVNGTQPQWLFPSPTRPDMPVTLEQVGQAMKTALLAAGLRKIRPHDLRDTYLPVFALDIF